MMRGARTTIEGEKRLHYYTSNDPVEKQNLSQCQYTLLAVCQAPAKHFVQTKFIIRRLHEAGKSDKTLVDDLRKLERLGLMRIVRD